MKKFLCFAFCSSLLFADDYSFDMGTIEVKSYDYSGHIKAEHKFQNLNENSSMFASKNKDYMNSYFGEAQLDFQYFYEDFKLNSKFTANYEDIDSISEDTYTIDELHVDYTLNENQSFTLGKKSLKWGKGYFFNPVAFMDRKKDPNNPENAREGYVLGSYTFNKSYEGDLKNFGFNVVFMPTNDDVNEDFYTKNSKNLALKAYFLYKDIDIDLLYMYSDELNDKLGVDFAFNVQTNLELHGEFAKEINGYNSYLLGAKYLTQNDLTIISEYFYQSKQLPKTTSFWDKEYFINKFSQKEPLDILYSSVYYKNALNLDDYSHSNAFGFTYKFQNNIDFDISYNVLVGKKDSEFGSKLNESFLWTQVTWYF